MDSFNLGYDFGVDLEVLIPAIAIGAAQATKPKSQPQNTSLPGGKYLRELLCSNPKRIYNVLHMRSETFIQLCNWLEVNTALESTCYVAIQEQVAIFL